MTKFGKFLKFVRAITVWQDGDGQAFCWNWWHPLAWLFVPFVFVLSIIVQGFPDTWHYRHNIGLGLSKYWRERRNERKFL